MTLQEIKTEALRYGYILRRVGHKHAVKVQAYRADGKPARNCYIPHIPCDARMYAHTHRTFGNLRKLIKRQGLDAGRAYADIWGWVLAAVDEFIAREITSEAEEAANGK